MDFRRNMNKSSVESSSFILETQKILGSLGKSVLYVFLFIIVLYVLYYTYVYYTIKCEPKIPYFTYLFNFGNQGICTGKVIDETNISDILQEEHSLSSIPDVVDSKPLHDEVFQISNQLYNYEDARCKCESYGAKLATKAQVIDAYNKGAHWCNYGWVDGGEAYYPVQQCELDKKAQLIRDYNKILKYHYDDPQKYTYQMVKDARNKMEKEGALEFCGYNAGLNGGAFNNKNTRFGATCFGKKPEGMSIREKEAKCEATEAQKARDEEERKAYEAQKRCGGKLDSDKIASFSPDKWNE